MNERLVEDWLNKASERSFQTPFSQALLSEGKQVLRVGHSSHEHGKDIIAIDPKGKIHAYQLKDGDLDLKRFEEGLDQLIALVETQVEHPAITGGPRHQPWLVVSGKLSMPVEDRIRVHNATWRKRRFTPLKVITGMAMLARFTKMAANFWPQTPEDARSFLSLYLADGKGVLDRAAFAKLIVNLVTTEGEPVMTEVGRRLAAANLFASYSLSPFVSAGNHWEVLQGWTITAAHLAWAADKAGLEIKVWQPTFRLAVDAALVALDALVAEALEPRALGPCPNLELDEITRARCTICGGALAIRLLLSVTSGKHWELAGAAKQTIERMLRAGRFVIWGESAVPFFLAAIWALEATRADLFAEGILLMVLSTVTQISCRATTAKLSSPYESVDGALAKTFRQNFEQKDVGEEEAPASYTLDPLVTLAARRLWRNQL